MYLLGLGFSFLGGGDERRIVEFFFLFILLAAHYAGHNTSIAL